VHQQLVHGLKDKEDCDAGAVTIHICVKAQGMHRCMMTIGTQAVAVGASPS